MSRDLRVWGRRGGNIARRFAATGGWTANAGGIVRATRSWQVAVGLPQPVEPEDLPEGASDLLPGLSFLVELSLEPIDAPGSARSVLLSAARVIAEDLAGLVEDPQDGTLKVPRGAKRYVRPERARRITALDLSWWYAGSPLRAPGGVTGLLSVLRRNVPEAVPTRYGLWEPPPSRTDRTGIDALAAFLSGHLDEMVVLYTTKPVIGVRVADCDGAPHPRLGFRANHFRIRFEASVLEQAGWERAVRRLWRDVSRFLQPCYGEARLLSGLIPGRATTSEDMQTAIHPVRSWFWRGIPSSPGIALVLGPPYASLWRPTGAVADGGLLFAEREVWSGGKALDIAVPRAIAQPWNPGWVREPGGGFAVNWCDGLPETFPF